MKKSLLLFSALFTLFFLPSTSFAAMENCDTAGLPNLIPNAEDWEEFYHEDWREAMILRADDGTVWQRAILTNKNGRIVLNGGVPRIRGVGEENSPLQLFIFPSPTGNESIPQPADGMCFSLGNTRATGEFSLPVPQDEISSQLGSNMIFDVYTQLSGKWSQYTRADTNQNFFIATHIPIQSLKVSLPQPEEGSALLNCQSLCAGVSGEVLYTAHTLSLNGLPTNRPELIPDDFIREVRITRNPEALYFSGISENPLADDADLSYSQKMISLSLTAEWLKRMILPTESTRLGLIAETGLGEGIVRARIRDIDEGVITIGDDYKNMLDQIKARLTGSNTDISALANRLSMNNEYAWQSPDILGFLEEILPSGVSTNESWATDFEEIIRFWTGAQQENECLLSGNKRILINGISSFDWTQAEAIRCNMNRTLSI